MKVNILCFWCQKVIHEAQRLDKLGDATLFDPSINGPLTDHSCFKTSHLEIQIAVEDE